MERCRTARPGSIAFGALALGVSVSLFAPAAAGGDPSHAPAECTKGSRSALEEIACELGRGLREAPARAFLVADLPVSDRPLADGRALSLLITRLVSGKLGATARGASETGDLTRARTLARKYTVLVHLVPKIQSGELQVTADVYPAYASFWDRIRLGPARATAHAFASRRIDGEIGTFLKQKPLVSMTTEKALAPGKAVALACGDADGDGSIELLVVGRQRLWLGRVNHHRFAVEHEAGWSGLAGVASSPLRQPIAAATIHDEGFIDVGVTDRGTAVRLSGDLRQASPLSGAVPWDGIGCLTVSGTALGGVRPCLPGESAKITPDTPKVTVDAVASAHFSTRTGERRFVFASRANDGVITLTNDARDVVLLPDAGAQIALGDLDLDGRVEIVTTQNTLDPSLDAVVVHTWTGDNAIEERFRIAVPRGVLALAVCPPEAPGLSLVTVATGDELWLIR